MTFESPTPLAEAIRLLLDKRLVPTTLSSVELRELAAEVKNAALFSARMTQIRPLAVLQQVLEEMLRGNANMADAKLALGKVYEAMGYDAEAGGFPQDAPGTVPPALSGSLRDLASQERMALTIETNYRMVTNAAFVAEATANEDAIYHFPCFELRRTRGRRTPRGFVRRKGGMEVKPGDDWPSRWVAAGGELFDRGTRMIAAKDSPVWQALGEGAGGYTDTLGNPFPPFAWGSGMGLREISRTEALLLGVITEEDEIAKMPVTMAKALQADAKNVPPEILEAFGDDLEEDLGRIQRRRARRAAVEAARNRRLAWLADVLGNAGTHAGAVKGWETRRARGWTPLQIEETQKGMRAMNEVIASKQDKVAAMNLPGIGPVDFRWSVGSRGIRRIFEDHKIARRIPLILARGKVTQGKTRVFVDYKGHRVVLAKDFFGQPSNNWVITGYRDKEGHPMNSVKILIQQSLCSRQLHVLHCKEGAGGLANSNSTRDRCKLFTKLLQKGVAP